MATAHLLIDMQMGMADRIAATMVPQAVASRRF